jgi:hypothetical protein
MLVVCCCVILRRPAVVGRCGVDPGSPNTVDA